MTLSQVLRRLLTGGIGRPPWDLPERPPGDRYVVLVACADSGDAGPGDGDPALSPVGMAQADALADALAALRPMPVVTAPDRRSVETAAPLARRWGVEPYVERALAAPAPGNVIDAVTALGADTVVVADPAVVRMVAESAGGNSGDGGPGYEWEPGPASRTMVRLGRSGMLIMRWGEGVGES